MASFLALDPLPHSGRIMLPPATERRLPGLLAGPDQDRSDLDRRLVHVQLLAVARQQHLRLHEGASEAAVLSVPSILLQLMLPLLQLGNRSGPCPVLEGSADVRCAMRVHTGRRQNAHCKCQAADPTPGPLTRILIVAHSTTQAAGALQHCRSDCGAHASKCSSDNPPKPTECGADPNLCIVDYGTDASWKCPKDKCSALLLHCPAANAAAICERMHAARNLSHQRTCRQVPQKAAIRQRPDAVSSSRCGGP